MVAMGPRAIDRAAWDWDEVARNPFWCPDAGAAADWAVYLDELRKYGNSVGAVIEVVASGAPAGLGAPVYAKLDTEIAAALMSINAVKGVEIGAGFGAAALTGRRERRRDRDGQRRAAVLVESCGRHPRRHLDRSGHRGAVRGEADVLDPDAAAHDHRDRRGRPRS